MTAPYIPPQPAIAARCSDTASLVPVLAQAHMNAMGLAYACAMRGDEATMHVHHRHARAIRNELRIVGRDVMADTLQRSAAETLGRFLNQPVTA